MSTIADRLVAWHRSARRWIVRRGGELHRRLLRSERLRRSLGRSVLVLTAAGNTRGVSVPLFYVRVGEILYVVPSFGGNDEAPLWYRRVCENPDVVVECDGVSARYRARTLQPEETVALWPRVLGVYPGYARDQKRTGRWIPIVELVPN